MSAPSDGRKRNSRPRIGLTKKISVTLPAQEWERIESLIENGHAKSISEYFRAIHESQFKTG